MNDKNQKLSISQQLKLSLTLVHGIIRPTSQAASQAKRSEISLKDFEDQAGRVGEGPTPRHLGSLQPHSNFLKNPKSEKGGTPGQNDVFWAYMDALAVVPEIHMFALDLYLKSLAVRRFFGGLKK